MIRARYSIASLVILSAVSAFAFAALKEHTALWASSTFTLMLGLLLVATLSAFRASEPRRTFWLGFALCGWVYGVITFAPGADSALAPQLLTTQLVEKYAPSQAGEYAFTYSSPASLKPVRFTPTAALPGIATSGTSTVTTDAKTGKILTVINQGPPPVSGPQKWVVNFTNSPAPTPNAEFVRIGKALSVLAVGMLGGLFAVFFFVPRRLEQDAGAEPKSLAEGGDAA